MARTGALPYHQHSVWVGWAMKGFSRYVDTAKMVITYNSQRMLERSNGSS